MVVTVMFAGAEVTIALVLSVATAVRLYNPGGTLLHRMQEYGLFVVTPRLFVPAKNCTLITGLVK